MITSLEVLVRSTSDLGTWADMMWWWNDRPAGRFYTLAECADDPTILLDIDELARLWNQWEREGWLETKREAGRIMYRPTDGFPIISEHDWTNREAIGAFVTAYRILRRKC
jgi:hypothetical protein